MAEACEQYLRPTYFLDCDHPDVCAFAARHAGSGGEREKATRLNLAVRDGIRYDPYSFRLIEEGYKASHCLATGAGFCVPKAILLAASARAVGIPSRLGYANVRNHLTSARLSALMGSDVFRWHGYVSLFIEGRWLKATPAFDIGLCHRAGIRPLDFDATTDSIFHPFDATGRLHMEYLDDLGEFDDFPYDIYAGEMRRHYAGLIAILDDEDQRGSRPPDDTFAS